MEDLPLAGGSVPNSAGQERDEIGLPANAGLDEHGFQLCPDCFTGQAKLVGELIDCLAAGDCVGDPRFGRGEMKEFLQQDGLRHRLGDDRLSKANPPDPGLQTQGMEASGHQMNDVANPIGGPSERD